MLDLREKFQQFWLSREKDIDFIRKVAKIAILIMTWNKMVQNALSTTVLNFPAGDNVDQSDKPRRLAYLDFTHFHFLA